MPRVTFIAGLLVLRLLLSVDIARGDVQQAFPDLRFILQTQAGLTAYSQITGTISLDYVRPLFTNIEQETSAYLLGTYTLSGTGFTVKLAITTDGWAAAFHTPDYRVERLYDCNHPSPDDQVFNRPETAILEVAAALGVSNPAISFYDYRNPQTDHVTLHWLIITNGFGNITSTITLPLANTYLEHGYAFCTAFTNSKFWLNGVIVDEQGSLSQPIFRYNSLTENQLRAGQSNGMKIEAFSIFGNGFMSGVGVEYIGTTAISTAGGYRRDFDLTYPSMLGPLLPIMRTYLPMVRK